MSINKLIEICNLKIKIIKDKISVNNGLNNENYAKELEILEITKKLLETRGERAFFEMDMNTSLKILNKLVDKDKVLTVYANLISPKAFLSIKSDDKEVGRGDK